MIDAVLVLFCGGLGAIARFVVDGLVQSHVRSEFPLGTLVVNLGGAFLLGLLVGLDASHRVTLLLVVGGCNPCLACTNHGRRLANHVGGWQCCTAQVGVLANRAIFGGFRAFVSLSRKLEVPLAFQGLGPAVADGAEPEKLPQQGVRRGKRTSSRVWHGGSLCDCAVRTGARRARCGVGL